MDPDLVQILDSRIAEQAAWQATDLLIDAIADLVLRADQTLWQAGDGYGGALHERFGAAFAARGLEAGKGAWRPQ